MNNRIVDIGLGGTHCIGKRQSLGELSCKSRRECAARAVGITCIYSAGAELYHLISLMVVEDVDELVIDEVTRLEEYRHAIHLCQAASGTG